ncbi:MAG: plasmid pRiA4b ORF-3 family protein [Nitrospiraceae bacterium]|nr:plasmid pRiA4b ORF-3 family protein [Nitrospiraceae bacterium]
MSKKFANKEIRRVIEIRGDQTLEDLHYAIFKAYDRWDEHLYEFQFGKRPFDPDGIRYGVPGPRPGKKGHRDARTTTLDELDLEPERVFGYWFDFGDDWYHQIQVERIEQAIPTVTYPRVIKRVGKSPPQYSGEEWLRSGGEPFQHLPDGRSSGPFLRRRCLSKTRPDTLRIEHRKWQYIQGLRRFPKNPLRYPRRVRTLADSPQLFAPQ